MMYVLEIDEGIFLNILTIYMGGGYLKDGIVFYLPTPPNPTTIISHPSSSPFLFIPFYLFSLIILF
jgi:hypothetical protein